MSEAAKIAVGGREPVSMRSARSRAVRDPCAPSAASTSTPSSSSTRLNPSNRSRLEVKPYGFSNASATKPMERWPERVQIAGDEPATGDVVAPHDRQTRGDRAVDIDQHDRNRSRGQRVKVLGRRRQGDEEDAVGPVRCRQLAEVALATVRALDVVDHDVEGAVAEHGLGAPQPLHRLGPGQV